MYHVVQTFYSVYGINRKICCSILFFSGQTSKTFVHRFFMKSSVEEKILEMQEKKRKSHEIAIQRFIQHEKERLELDNQTASAAQTNGVPELGSLNSQSGDSLVPNGVENSCPMNNSAMVIVDEVSLLRSISKKYTFLLVFVVGMGVRTYFFTFFFNSFCFCTLFHFFSFFFIFFSFFSRFFLFQFFQFHLLGIFLHCFLIFCISLHSLIFSVFISLW